MIRSEWYDEPVYAQCAFCEEWLDWTRSHAGRDHGETHYDQFELLTPCTLCYWLYLQDDRDLPQEAEYSANEINRSELSAQEVNRKEN